MKKDVIQPDVLSAQKQKKDTPTTVRKKWGKSVVAVFYVFSFTRELLKYICKALCIKTIYVLRTLL